MRLITKSLGALGALLILTGCEPIGFRTTSIDDIAWEGSDWIAARSATPRAGANWFVCSVTNKKAVVSVKWMTTATGPYETYVNGRLVGMERFKNRDSLTYDLTEGYKVEPGQVNRFAAEVYPDGGLFRGVIEIVYRDGREDFIGTNVRDWQSTIGGPVRCAPDGTREVQDARLESPLDDDEVVWVKPIRPEGFFGDIRASFRGEPLLRQERAQATEFTLVADESREVTFDAPGAPCMEIDAAKGTIITVTPGYTYICCGSGDKAIPKASAEMSEKFVVKSSAPAVIRFISVPVALVNTTQRSRISFELDD